MLIEHRAGTREVHNKLEKNRRAHLRECFEFLRKQLPAIDDKKLSNLGILKSALRHIQVKMRAFISTQLLTSMFNVTLLTRRCLFACVGEWSCRRCDEQNELRCPFFFFSVLKGPFGLNTRKPSVHIIRGYGAKLGKACKVYDIKLFTAPLIENELVRVFLRCDDEKYLGVDRCFKRGEKTCFWMFFFFLFRQWPR